MPLRESNYTTLMMATGLTFGSISALFGYNYGYINQAQYSLLVTVVIASAVIPTIIAQVFFQPREVGPMGEAGLRYEGTAEHFLHSAEE
jgi:Kef-type K+ transport system membrane component KefB